MGLSRSLLGVFKSLAFGVPVTVTVLDCFGYVAKVEGISMQPALNPDNNLKDFVLLSRWAVRNFTVDRGDIVSLSSPQDPDQKIIKRVIGLEGDVIRTINYRDKVVRVPQGHCWIEGDHTGHSMDSNYFGPVSVGLVVAKASHIVWPPRRWQRITANVPETRQPLNIERYGNRNFTYLSNKHDEEALDLVECQTSADRNKTEPDR